MTSEAKPRNTLMPEDPYRPPVEEPARDSRRRFDGVAEEHTLRALAESEWERHESGNTRRTRALRGDAARAIGACGRFARWLAVREREDEAVRYAKLALQMTPDAGLRSELVGWLVKLGRLSDAAEELAPLGRRASPRDRAEIGQRRAIFFAKSGDFAQANACLEEALGSLPGDPLTLELSGAIASRIPGKLGLPAERYLAAAHVRRDRGETDVAVFDVCRALVAGGDVADTSRTLASWFSKDGKHERAQEVLRAASHKVRGQGLSHVADSLTRERRQLAIEADEPLLALLAAVDAGEDRRFGDDDARVSSLLLQAGLLEWLAGRTLLAALISRDPAERSLRLDSLARLYQGPLSSSEHAESARRLGLRLSGIAALCARMDNGLRAEARDALVAMCRGTEMSSRRAAAEEIMSRVGDEHQGYVVVALRVIAAAGSESGTNMLTGALENARRVESALSKMRATLVASPEEIDQLLPCLETAVEWPSIDVELVECFVFLFSAFAQRGYVPLTLWRIGDRLATRMGEARTRLTLWKRLLVFDAESRNSVAHDVRGDLVRRIVESALECGDTSFAMSTLKEELPRADAMLVSMTVALARTLGDDPWAARALSRVAAPTPACAAALSALASEWAASFDATLSRQCAERACQTDPRSIRAVVALADATGPREPIVRAAALERVSLLVVPTVEACAECAALLRGAGKPALAIAWARQWASLAPGSREAMRVALEAAVESGDAAIVVETVEWAIGQTGTRDEVADAIDIPFGYLEREEPTRAVLVARRLLRTVGVPSPAWGARLRILARNTGEVRLALSLAETSGPVSSPDAFIELAAFAREIEDLDAEVRYLVCALRGNNRDADVVARVQALCAQQARGEDNQAFSGDTIVALVEATALLAGEGPAPRARALRDYGFALWELAGDDTGAVEAWFAAAALSPARGFATMRTDLMRAFGGHGAFDVLEEHASKAVDGKTAAGLSRQAAQVSLEIGENERAFVLAVRALELDPERADALEVAERAAIECNGLDRLATQYDRMALRARGRYGRRAAHFRAARFFLGADQYPLAFQQATSAFMAVPTEGSSLRLLCEAAERGENRVGVARALEQVAQRERSNGDRATWFLRAAEYAGEGEDGIALRTDLLLAAFAALPTPGIAKQLYAAVVASRQTAPMALASTASRVHESWEGARKRLEGPDGARVAIVFSATATDAFGDRTKAWETLITALELDGDVDDYGALMGSAHGFAGDPDALARAMDVVTRPYSNVGIAAYELLHRIAVESRHPDFIWQTAALAAVTERSDRVIERAVSLAPARDARGDRLIAVVGRKAILDAVERASIRANAAGKANWVERLTVGLRRLFDEATVTELASRVAAGGIAGPAPEGEAAGWSDSPVEPTPDLAVNLPVSPAMAPPLPSTEALVRSEKPPRPSMSGMGWSSTSPEPRRSASPDGNGEVADGVRGIEDALREHQDYDGLADYLGRRIEVHERSHGSDDLVRALRLRRAAVLEQHLDRIVEARAELEKTLSTKPAHAATRRYAIDLADRARDWDYVESRLGEWLDEPNTDPSVRSEWLVRLGRLFVARGSFDRADALASRISVEGATIGELCLIARIARGSEDPARHDRALALLEGMSDGGQDDSERAALFLEASQDALARGDTQGAIRWAHAAERAERPKGSVALFGLALRYKLTRWSTSEARHAQSVLESINIPQLNADDVSLRALLLAEARDEAIGDNQGLRVLREAELRFGRHPLIAIGMAERLARLGACAEALPYFDVALTGNLFGLRRQGAVALAAADAARSLGEDERACAYLERAAEDPRFLTRARRRLADVLLVVGRVDEARRVLRELAPRVDADERAHTLRDLALTFSQADPGQEIEHRRLLGEARDIATTDALREDIDRQLRRHRESMMPPMNPTGEPPLVIGAKTIAARASARIRVARDLLVTDSASSEALLRRAVDEGSVDACDELALLLERRRAPWTDVVVFRRMSAERTPGHLGRLEALARAAREDRNVRYVAALDHVISCFGPRHLVRLPPPIFHQTKIAGFARMLMDPSVNGGGEIFAALWGDARDLWVRRYARPTVGRNSPLPSHFLELVEASMTLLDCGRVQVEGTRGVSERGFDIRLTGPSVVITGDLTHDTSDLRYLLGTALAAAHPMHVLAHGTPFDTFARIWKAVEIAFGDRKADDDADARGVIAGLWEMVSSQNQRRIRAWLTAHPDVTPTRLAEEARQSGRRTGLFVAGDFGVVARLVAREHAVPESEADSAYGLEALCRDIPALTDLYRLALSPEYAEARWGTWSPATGAGP